MRIHELNTYTGTPGEGDWLAIDNGNETTKVEAKQITPFKYYYGTSSTAASTATKVVTCPGFALETGALLSVQFTYASTSTATSYLNVNNTGAKRIRRANGSTQAVNNVWDAGDIVTFVYDGSSWVLTGTEADIASSVLTTFTSQGWSQDSLNQISSLLKFIGSWIEKLQVTTPTASITDVTAGSVQNLTVKKCGNICQLYLYTKTTAAVPVGSDCFKGTLSQSALRPVVNVRGIGYAGQNVFVAGLNTNGALTIRNTGNVQVAADADVTVTFTYIIA